LYSPQRGVKAAEKIGKLVKSPKPVMPDLIPAEYGIFDRHPEVIEIIRLRRTFAGMK
jgi:hypothetical protein